MISIETRFEGFDLRSWHRLATLIAPWLTSLAPHERAARAGEPGGGLFVMYHQARVQRALHTHKGLVSIEHWPGAGALADLARDQGAHFAVAAESGALEELYERIGGRVRIDDSPAALVLTIAGAVRELEEEGALHVWPRVFPSQVPLPTATAVERVIDYVLPENHSALVALFGDDGLDTAMLVHRRGAFVDCVYGPESIRAMVGPLGGDFRRDYRVIRRAIESRLGSLAVGLYADTETLRELLRQTHSGAWAEAIASRDVIFDPLPGWLAVAAGAGYVRAAAGRSKSLLAGLGILGALTPAVQRLREVAQSVGSLDVTRLLGFDPMRVLAQVLRIGDGSTGARSPRDDDDANE